MSERATIGSRLLLGLLVLLAGAGRAAVTLTPDRWELDPPLPLHQGAQRSFVLRNSGAARVELGPVTAHPPLLGQLTRTALEPGEVAQLRVSVQPQSEPGALDGQVGVRVAGQAPLTLTVHGRCVQPHTGLLPAVAAGQPYAPRPGDQPLVAQVFYHSTCITCMEWLRTVIDPLTRHFDGWVRFDRHDIWQPDGEALLARLKTAHHREEHDLAWLFVGSHALTGSASDADVYRLLLDELAHPTPAPTTAAAKAAPAASGSGRSLALGPAGALAVGLLDGLNPCAFATIVFLIALLTRLGADRRTLLAAGAAYTAAVYATYTLLGLGLLRAFGLLGAARALRWAVAAFALVFAGLQLRDALRLRRGEPTRALSAGLPPRLQQTVHALLRWSTRPGRGRLLLTLAMLGAGVLVTLVEMVCTSEVYLPVLALLRTEGLRSRALPLLLTYNAGFVLPLVAVVALALRGLGSDRLAAFARRHLALAKCGLALLLVCLAVLLVWR